MSSERLSCLLLLVIALTVRAEESPGENPKKDPGGTPVSVRLHVLVTDKDGKPSDDLRLEDLKVSEDGVEQKLVSLEKVGPSRHVAFLVEGSLRQELNFVAELAPSLAGELTREADVLPIRFIGPDEISAMSDWTKEKDRLAETFQDLFTESGKPVVLDAVHVAAESVLGLKPPMDPLPPSAIVLITGGVDFGSYYALRQVLDKLKEAKIEVFVISAGKTAPKDDKSALEVGEALAFETGGWHHALPQKSTIDDMETALHEVCAQLQSRYVATYHPVNQARDGTVRSLTVTVARPPDGSARTARITPTVTVPKK